VADEPITNEDALAALREGRVHIGCVDVAALKAWLRSLPTPPDESEPAASPAAPPRNGTAGARQRRLDAGAKNQPDPQPKAAATRRRWWRFSG
jgi:hypothetical protein